jgi:secreted PhoX family phosphatase
MSLGATPRDGIVRRDARAHLRAPANERIPMSNEERAVDGPSAVELTAGERIEGQYFGDVVSARLARRALLQGLGAAGVGLVVTPVLLGSSPAFAHGKDPGAALRFEPIAPSGADDVIVPEQYVPDVVIRWGDPILAGAPEFEVEGQTAERQRKQFGFNCDFVAEYPLPRWVEEAVEQSGELPARASAWINGEFRSLLESGASGSLLWVNHEYTSGREMFVGYDADAPTAEQVDIELAAHGGSLVKLKKRDGRWTYDRRSRFNRRITGETPMLLTGPAAGDPQLTTSEDPTGYHVRGMFNNCGGGITPWGTVLTCEENFDQYFANGSALAAADPAKAASYSRLAPPSGASGRKWERFHPRFDVSKEPNEYARFGYVVEVDPYDPTSTPRKHTALGRFKHEAAVPVITRHGHVAVYSGDDARFEYAYKFVSERKFAPHDRRRNMKLLEAGTLYVAKFLEDGTGTWLPLVHGEGPLTAANGFNSQADVSINTRRAADLVGATRLDRPEDIEVSPVTKKVYIALTNNSARTAAVADAGEAAANPRLNNRWGHVIEIEEDCGDNAALDFRWEIFLLCGDPATTPGVYFAGFDPAQVSPISCPDNLDFDALGNLWIATDGSPASPGFAAWNDGIFAVPTEGAERGYVRQFLSGVRGCEVASLKHSADGRTLFATIQHPGEDQGLPNAVSSWPDGTNLPPRPSVVAVRHVQKKRIGS